ncbi:MAG: TIGR00725 family protein [bacterium]
MLLWTTRREVRYHMIMDHLALEAGRLNIAVCGAGDCEGETAELARRVGEGLARAGAVVICGGLEGVMEASCRGAFEAGGLTVGILPGGSLLDANRFVKVAVATNLGESRNAVIVHSALAVIAISGGYGTLSEIALARKTGKPVVSLHSWEMGPDIIKAEDADEAVKLALEAAEPRRRSVE